MPELPEVKVIRCDLAEAIVGCTIQSVDTADEMVLVNISREQFAQRLLFKQATQIVGSEARVSDDAPQSSGLKVSASVDGH